MAFSQENDGGSSPFNEYYFLKVTDKSKFESTQKRTDLKIRSFFYLNDDGDVRGDGDGDGDDVRHRFLRGERGNFPRGNPLPRFQAPM